MYEFSITLSDGSTPVIGNDIGTTYFTKDGCYTVHQNYNGSVTMIRSYSFKKDQGSK